jgi:hypothetical protein
VTAGQVQNRERGLLMSGSGNGVCVIASASATRVEFGIPAGEDASRVRRGADSCLCDALQEDLPG